MRTIDSLLHPGTEERALALLARDELTLTELAAQLGVAKQTAIRTVDRLEKRGLVARVAVPGDRRRKALRLTADGRAERRAALRRQRELEAVLLGELTARRAREAA